VTERRVSALVFAAVLVLYGAGLTAAGAVGALASYVGPRLSAAALAAAAGMLVIGVVALLRERAGQGHVRATRGLVVFAVPLLFAGFSLAHTPAEQIALPEIASRIGARGASAVSPAENVPSRLFGPPEADASPDSAAPGALSFGDDTFYADYTALHEQPGRYRGNTVVLEGLVHREPRLAPSQFYLSRRLMWCCSADAVPLRTLVRADAATLPRGGAWARVSGTVEILIEGDRVLPVIRAEQIDYTARPDFDFVLPF
jgi:uncharacterized repeat protein (TIGR03943 family)